jgi:hypothetical protein
MNQSIEHFPVGRRLAFDGARGRLWVVCRECERWNLTPLDERWEAIEECERLFRATRLRVSTDNIGLARLPDGLELVRIGSPQRPEMAAWRYGDQFGRRRRKHIVYTALVVGAAGGVVLIGPATGIIAGGSWAMWNVINTMNNLYQQRRVRARLVLPEFTAPVAIRLAQLNRVSVVRTAAGWGLRFPFEAPASEPVARSDGGESDRPRWKSGDEIGWIVTGDAALQAAGKLLPAINAAGARRDEVDSAVQLISEVAQPANLFDRYAAQTIPPSERRTAGASGTGHVLANLPKAVRLALEMAAHEDNERRALEGELSLLETAWQEAEEIAAIADDMFVSDDDRARLSELKRTTPGD